MPTHAFNFLGREVLVPREVKDLERRRIRVPGERQRVVVDHGSPDLRRAREGS